MDVFFNLKACGHLCNQQIFDIKYAIALSLKWLSPPAVKGKVDTCPLYLPWQGLHFPPVFKWLYHVKTSAVEGTYQNLLGVPCPPSCSNSATPYLPEPTSSLLHHIHSQKNHRHFTGPLDSSAW